MGLESDFLKGAEFRAALKSLVMTLGNNRASQIELHIDPVVAEGLSSLQATELLHVGREAMVNSLKHAGARNTDIILQRTKDGVRFEVKDDGVGFSPGATSHSGHGLKNMAARATALGARFAVFSRIGEGTRIVLDIPAEKEPNRIFEDEPNPHIDSGRS